MARAKNPKGFESFVVTFHPSSSQTDRLKQIVERWSGKLGKEYKATFKAASDAESALLQAESWGIAGKLVVKNPRACTPGSCRKISLARRYEARTPLRTVSGGDPVLQGQGWYWYGVTKSFPTVKAAVADAKAKMPQYEWRGGFVKDNPKKRNPSEDSQIAALERSLRDRAARAVNRHDGSHEQLFHDADICKRALGAETRTTMRYSQGEAKNYCRGLLAKEPRTNPKKSKKNPALSRQALVEQVHRAQEQHGGRTSDTWWVYVSDEHGRCTAYGPHTTHTEAKQVRTDLAAKHPNWSSVLTHGSPLSW